jgi:hypothetical protein
MSAGDRPDPHQNILLPENLTIGQGFLVSRPNGAIWQFHVREHIQNSDSYPSTFGNAQRQIPNLGTVHTKTRRSLHFSFCIFSVWGWS